MNRRQFLKGMLAAGATVVASKYLALSDEALANDSLFTGELGRYESIRLITPAFDPTKEYGMSFPWDGKLRGHDEDFLRNLVREDARTILPPGTWYDLRLSPPQDLGLSRIIAWYYGPGSSDFYGRNFTYSAKSVTDAKYIDWGGFYLLERTII
jgi:hypothetical protein